MAKRKSLFKKIRCFLRKWISSKIIPFKNCKGGGYCLWHNNRRKCDCRSVYACEQKYSGRSYCGRRALQNCCEVAA